MPVLFQRILTPRRVGLAALGAASGLMTGLLVTGAWPHALFAAGFLLLGGWAGLLRHRLGGRTRACLRALRRMPLPDAPRGDAGDRVMVCIDAAHRLLSGLAGRDGMPTAPALMTYVRGISEGYYGSRFDSPPWSEQEVHGATLWGAPTLTAIRTIGMDQGRRIRDRAAVVASSFAPSARPAPARPARQSSYAWRAWCRL